MIWCCLLKYYFESKGRPIKLSLTIDYLKEKVNSRTKTLIFSYNFKISTHNSSIGFNNQSHRNKTFYRLKKIKEICIVTIFKQIKINSNANSADNCPPFSGRYGNSNSKSAYKK